MVEGGGEKCLVGEGREGDWGGRLVSWLVLTVLRGDCRGLLAGGDRCCSVSRGLRGLGLLPDFISALCSEPGDCLPPPSSDLMLLTGLALPGPAAAPGLLLLLLPSLLTFCWLRRSVFRNFALLFWNQT